MIGINKSFEFALKIIELYKILQEQKEFVLSKQLLRSGTNTGANINEALARISKVDLTNKMSISSKEARESFYWLVLLDKSQLVKFDFKTFIQDCEELVKMLTSIIKTTKNSTLKTGITIFEITKERLSRVAKKINAGLDEKIEKLKKELHTEKNKAEITKNVLLKSQNTFKVFETTLIWEDYYFEANEFNPHQELFNIEKLSEEDIKALLTTWKTYDGIALTQELESVDLSGYSAYYSNGRFYLMNKDFTTDSLKTLLEKIDTEKYFEPKSIIAFGYHFESKNLREISENLKSYNNKKKSDIDFITRY